MALVAKPSSLDVLVVDDSIQHKPSTSQVTKTSDDRKKEAKETKARTERLYNQLDEVKARKVEQDRKDEYARNRDKAKEYEKVLFRTCLMSMPRLPLKC